MNHANCRRHKNGINKLFDLNRFDEWFEVTYQPVNCGKNLKQQTRKMRL